MTRFALLTLVLIVLAPSVAMAHGIEMDHVHEEPGLPVAEVLAGLAFILSASSFWISLRTMRLVARERE